MSFIEKQAGQVYAPGWFLADQENVTRVTAIMQQNMAETAADGSKYVPMGKIWPSNDQNAVGIVYEMVDVTSGDMPGSLVTNGIVEEFKLPETVTENAKTALESKGITFIAVPNDVIKRPY